jgi:hypothetical protein
MSKNGTVIALRKPYKDENALIDVIAYMLNSVFAELDEIIAYGVEINDCNQIINDFLEVQSRVDMVNHRKIFHILLTAPISKHMQRMLENAAIITVEYFGRLGYQVIAVPHYGSERVCENFHYHIAVNPISYLGNKRLLDRNETYSSYIAYLERETGNKWNFKSKYE